MHIQEIRKIAKGLGVRTGGLSKVAVIRSIQREEGNFDCFATDFEDACDQQSCLWRDDCRKASALAHN